MAQLSYVCCYHLHHDYVCALVKRFIVDVECIIIEGSLPTDGIISLPHFTCIEKSVWVALQYRGGGRLGLARLATRPTTSNNIVYYFHQKYIYLV